MALTSTLVWNVRPGGDDTNNGGAFDPGVSVPGTDFSLQDAAQTTYTDLVVDGAVNTKVTSAAFPFGVTHPGNLLNITGGAGWSTGRRLILSVAGNVATLDASPAGVGTTGGQAKLGGALASPGKAGGLKLANNGVRIKTGTYSLASASTNIAGGCIDDSTGGANGNPSLWQGYNTSPGDLSAKPVLQATVANCLILKASGNNVVFDNMTIDGNSQVNSSGCNLNASQGLGVRLTFKGCTTYTVHGTFFNSYVACDCSNQANADGMHGNGCSFFFCTSLNNSAGPNFSFQSSVVTAVSCVSGFATGGTGRGYYCDTGATAAQFIKCAAYGNAQQGWYTLGTSQSCGVYLNCIAYGNNGGFDFFGGQNGPSLWNCAVGSNGTNFPSGQPARTEGLITLTADPFNNAAAGDYGLNNTLGGGTSLRAAGFPATFPGIPTSNYDDVGPSQHQDSGGGGGGGGGSYPNAHVIGSGSWITDG